MPSRHLPSVSSSVLDEAGDPERGPSSSELGFAAEVRAFQALALTGPSWKASESCLCRNKTWKGVFQRVGESQLPLNIQKVVVKVMVGEEGCL